MDAAHKNHHVKRIQKKYKILGREFDERQRRLWACTEASEIGNAGPVIVAKVTGLSLTTIYQGIAELKRPGRKPLVRRIRAHGGGRKTIISLYPDLLDALDRLIEPTIRGDPESPLRWTCKSTRILSVELQRLGFPISASQVRNILFNEGYSLQRNRKTIEGEQHEDRNEQFEFINAEVTKAIEDGQPVISVDTKKKEIVGNHKNNGEEWSPEGNPTKVDVHDFPDPKIGKAVPYGIYDIEKNEGMVNVGISADTAEFAVASIQTWWNQMGCVAYPNARELTITADAGGSNGYRTRLWKYELQKFANKSGLHINVRHFPPGTSKWNKIEHRMFCHISSNWRARPLTDYATIVSLISNTTTRKGLTIKSVLDQHKYERGITISKEAMSTICLKAHDFRGEWNYTISPAT